MAPAQTTTPKNALVFVPAPGIGHLVSVMEFAKRLLERDDSFSITMLLMSPPFAHDVTTYVEKLNASHPEFQFLGLPSVTPPPLEDVLACPEHFVSVFIADHKNHVKDMIVNHVLSNKSVKLAGLVLDLFCTAFVDVAKDLGVPSYIFFASGAAFLGSMLYLPDRSDKGGVTYKPTDPDSIIPSYINPVPSRVLPSLLFHDGGYSTFVSHARKFKEAKGIIVNTFAELESHAVNYLNGEAGVPHVYTVGGALGRLGRAGVSIPAFGSTGSANDPTTRMPPPPPPGNRPSISSLGNRFLTSSNPSAPATGTTFAEKQHALQTANALYKDPSKVSFSDAKAAASTARNFQQRHGEQVAEGVRVGNAIGNKFGVIPTTANVAAPPTPPVNARYQPPPPPSRLSSTAPLTKKPPPPLPPKKKPPPPVPSAGRPPPPPVPLASRPPPIPCRSSPALGCPSTYVTSLPNSGLPAGAIAEIPDDLELSLETPWFTTSPLRLPQSIDRNPCKALRYSSSWMRSPSGRARHTLIISLLWTENLSSTKIRLTWDQSAPVHTIKAEQKHFPPPEPLTAQLLGQMTLRSAEIVQFCEERLGKQVGDGECWTLAFEALSNTPGMLPSQQATHGACIFSHFPPQAPLETQGADIHPGDILQFSKAYWDLGGGSWKAAGDPDHTAVVTAAHRERGEWRIQVLEQNVGGVKTVHRGEYCIGEGSGMARGSIRVFRPIEERPGWGCLEPEWEEE